VNIIPVFNHEVEEVEKGEEVYTSLFNFFDFAVNLPACKSAPRATVAHALAQVLRTYSRYRCARTRASVAHVPALL
jgi:hypothetical protein